MRQNYRNRYPPKNNWVENKKLFIFNSMFFLKYIYGIYYSFFEFISQIYTVSYCEIYKSDNNRMR